VKDLGFINIEVFDNLFDQAQEVVKLINGLIKRTQGLVENKSNFQDN
jgi:hypothetical protein